MGWIFWKHLTSVEWLPGANNPETKEKRGLPHTSWLQRAWIKWLFLLDGGQVQGRRYSKSDGLLYLGTESSWVHSPSFLMDWKQTFRSCVCMSFWTSSHFHTHFLCLTFFLHYWEILSIWPFQTMCWITELNRFSEMFSTQWLQAHIHHTQTFFFVTTENTFSSLSWFFQSNNLVKPTSPKSRLWESGENSDDLNNWHQGDPSDINQEDIWISKLGQALLMRSPMCVPTSFCFKNEENLISLSLGIFSSYLKTEYLCKFSVLPILCHSLLRKWVWWLAATWHNVGVASGKENQA